MIISANINSRSGAFTLLEVVLAIVIALGILVVLLYFYQQATNLRTQAIAETEKITAARLLLERLTTELRSARAGSDPDSGFVGTSNSIEFIKADVPSFASWNGGALGRALVPITDLKKVAYQLASLDGTNLGGLLRTEQPLIALRQGMNEDGTEDVVVTNTAPATNQVPLIEEIRFLQFRYWTGTNWADSWTLPGLPRGVEVSIGPDPATNDTETAEAPVEVFRRVIFVPGSSSALVDASTSTNTDLDTTTNQPPLSPEGAP